MKRAAAAVGCAFAYFSIFPVGGLAARSGPPDVDALLALPLVGAAIGALAGALAFAFAHVAPHPLVAAIALGASIVASGAIHLDGFLDGCDAFFVSAGTTRRLEILKDPRHGSFALAGLLVAGTTWYAALVSLPAETYPATLALAGAGSRVGAIVGALERPYARGGRLDPVGFVMVFALVLCAAFVMTPVASVLVLCAAPLGWLLARWVASRLDGALPGDGYGFIVTVLDVSMLAAAACLAAAGRWPGSG